MRVSKEEYDVRMRNIIGAFLRLCRRDPITGREGISPEKVNVKYLVHLYGFTHNFSKTEELRNALLDMYNWIISERKYKGVSPSPERMIIFVRRRIYV